MQTIKENHNGLSTYISLALIPISGFATDIFIPSLPSMATDLKVSGAAVQLTL
jgi:DHA1 family bicyclomycin/chloramphenicol resistance-like MFS transporter